MCSTVELIKTTALPPGSLGWQQLTSSGLSSVALSDLAKAVLLLHTDMEQKDWNTNTILAIIEELRGSWLHILDKKKKINEVVLHI